jgi:hypothetical protein
MRVPQVDIVVPVRNEERDLAPSIRRLVRYLRGRGSSAIAAWVAAHFKKLTVGGETVYDLTQPIRGTG